MPPNTNTWVPLGGATADTDGTAGYAPAPTKGNQNKFLRADATWQNAVTSVTAGTGLTGGTITTTGTISLDTSGVSAGTYGPTQTAATTASNGTKIRVPKITIDTYGRVTSASYIEFTAQNTNT